MKKLIFTIFLTVICTFFSSCTVEQNNKVNIPFSASDCKGKNYEMVVDEFEKIGFKNIELKTIADIKIGFLAKEGEVSDVSIGMNSKFKKGEEFNADDKVYITYHVKEIKEKKSEEANNETTTNLKESSTEYSSTITETTNQTNTESKASDDIEFVEISNNEEIKGSWIQVNGEGDRIHLAEIDNDTITIYVYFNSNDSTEIYWTGSFDSNIDITKGNVIKSSNYKYITDYLPNSSHVEFKEFLYDESIISYNASFYGKNEEIFMMKSKDDEFDTIKISGDRVKKFNKDTNKQIEFSNFLFEVPSYFDSKDESSTDVLHTYFSSDKSTNANLTFNHIVLDEEISKEGLSEYVVYLIEQGSEDNNPIEIEDVMVAGHNAVKVFYSFPGGFGLDVFILTNNNMDIINCGVYFDYADSSNNDYLGDFELVIENIKEKESAI